jgi:hypothetical protein
MYVSYHVDVKRGRAFIAGFPRRVVRTGGAVVRRALNVGLLVHPGVRRPRIHGGLYNTREDSK